LSESSGVIGPWCSAQEALATRPSDADSINQQALATGIKFATDILFVLSGRQYAGLTQKTVRPVSRPSGLSIEYWMRTISDLGGFYWSPRVGTWDYDTNIGDTPAAIPLGLFPIVSADEVTIDGNTVDPSVYRIDDARLLVRQDGSVWPVWQNINLPLGSQGTFGVTVTYGSKPPDSGWMAACIFAAEIAAGMSDLDTRLPSSIVSLARQNVTIQAINPMLFLDKGRTGIYEIDLFLSAYNPEGRRLRPKVYSPDRPRIRTS
jgi:hypothetical protein